MRAFVNGRRARWSHRSQTLATISLIASGMRIPGPQIKECCKSVGASPLNLIQEFAINIMRERMEAAQKAIDAEKQRERRRMKHNENVRDWERRTGLKYPGVTLS